MRKLHKVQIEPQALFLAALLLLTVPFRWVLAAAVAAAFHEICHLAAIQLLGGRVWKIRIGLRGARIETEPMSYARDVLAAAAGPVGSLMTLFLAKPFPRIAFCGILQTAYNLLPILPFDGGRIVQGILYCLFPRGKANTISRWIAVLTAVGILAVELRIGTGVLPVLLLLPVFQYWREIFLAKRREEEYNSATNQER